MHMHSIDDHVVCTSADVSSRIWSNFTFQTSKCPNGKYLQQIRPSPRTASEVVTTFALHCGFQRHCKFFALPCGRERHIAALLLTVSIKSLLVFGKQSCMACQVAPLQTVLSKHQHMHDSMRPKRAWTLHIPLRHMQTTHDCTQSKAGKSPYARPYAALIWVAMHYVVTCIDH